MDHTHTNTAVTVSSPLAGLLVSVAARPGSGADLASKLLAAHGAEVSAWDAVADPGADIVLIDDAGVLALRQSRLRPEVDADWAEGTIRCSVTLRGIALVEPGDGDRDNERAAQAGSGLIDCTGHPDAAPRIIGVPVAGVAAAGAALTSVAALLIRRRTDASKLFADVSLAECGFAVLASTHLPTVLTKGVRPPRVGNRHPAFAPWNVFRATDGWVQVCGGGGWDAQCDVFELDHLRHDPRFATPQNRFAHGDELDSAIAHWCASRTASEGIAAMSSVGVVAGGLYAPADTTIAELGSPIRLGSALRRRKTALLQDGHRPLTGLRVAELGAHTAGPLAGRVLAALGATVIKIEPPRGDPARKSATRMEGGDGYLYELNNIDKHSVAIDTSAPEGRARLHQIVASVDVLIQSLSPGLVEALVPRPEVGGPLRCDISGFPADGPRRLDKAFDAIIQAEAGIMTLTGSQDDPLKAGGSVVDQLSAVFAAAGIVLSLLGDTPVDVQISLQDIGHWLTAARLEAERGPATVVASRDGYVLVEHSSDDVGQRIDDERSRAELVEHLRGRGLTATPILGLDEACHDDRVRTLLIDVQDERRSARVLHVPLGLPAEVASSARPSPSVDQHLADVVSDSLKQGVS